ncbi:MAG: response regulator [bacterium]|nr:response regulator [bacterium]
MNNSSKNVLVVDDNSDAREMLAKMLEKLDWVPKSYESGQSALDDMANKDYQIAFLDIMMPHMNGYELLEKIRAIPEYKELPVIMVSAKDKDSEIMEGYQFGAALYITKPFTMKQIEYGIKMVLE